jgi:hypothetical protein
VDGRRVVTDRETKLLRLALDPAASDGEAASAACRWIESLRRSRVTADEILKGLDNIVEPELVVREVVKEVRVEVPSKKEFWESRVMPFGKWSNYTLREIADRAPGYLVWLRDKAKVRDALLMEAVDGALDWLGL